MCSTPTSRVTSGAVWTGVGQSSHFGEFLRAESCELVEHLSLADPSFHLRYLIVHKDPPVSRLSPLPPHPSRQRRGGAFVRNGERGPATCHRESGASGSVKGRPKGHVCAVCPTLTGQVLTRGGAGLCFSVCQEFLHADTCRPRDGGGGWRGELCPLAAALGAPPAD